MFFLLTKINYSFLDPLPIGRQAASAATTK